MPAAERFPANGPNPEQLFGGAELRRIISENLGELSPLLRTAFVLREIEGYSTGEAAKKLGVTVSSLKARVWPTRQQMAERLARHLRRIQDDATGRSRDSAAMFHGIPFSYQPAPRNETRWPVLEN